MNIVRYLAMRWRTIRGMTIVHVGAHYGEEAARYQDWGSRTVVWFEAAPDIFEKLEQHIAEVGRRPPSLFCRLTRAPRTRHVLVKALVGEDEGETADFHIFDNAGASNSMFKLKRGESDRFSRIRETGEVLKLPIRTLDRELDANGVAPESVDVLVVDVQGAEMMVLKGAARVLRSARYVESEVSREPVYEGGVLLSELEPWLAARGFRRRTMLTRPHMNAIFTR
jgi:FkbM family methyltransferase